MCFNNNKSLSLVDFEFIVIESTKTLLFFFQNWVQSVVYAVISVVCNSRGIRDNAFGINYISSNW